MRTQRLPPFPGAEQEVRRILGEGNLAGEQGCHEMNVLGIACVAAFAPTRTRSWVCESSGHPRAGAGQ